MKLLPLAIVIFVVYLFATGASTNVISVIKRK